MFASTVQSSTLSLFSSTSSNPFSLASVRVDASLPDDAGVLLLNDRTGASSSRAANDATLLGRDTRRFRLCDVEGDGGGGDGGSRTGEQGDGRGGARWTLLDQTVLHIQSPNIARTYLRIPPPDSTPRNKSGSAAAPTSTSAPIPSSLGVTLPYLHFQLRPLGSRPFVVEVGVTDARGRRGRVRASNFQRSPRLYVPPPPRARRGARRRQRSTVQGWRGGKRGREETEAGDAAVGQGGMRRSRGEPRNELSADEDEDDEEEEEEAEEGYHDASSAPKPPWSSSPLLHVPLATPSPTDTSVQTPWLSFCLPLAQVAPHLQDATLLGAPGGDDGGGVGDDGPSFAPPPLPPPPPPRFDGFASLDYVRVHANCRLRRVWCTRTPQGIAGLGQPELELYASAAAPPPPPPHHYDQ